MKIKAPHSVRVGPQSYKIIYKEKVYQTPNSDGGKEEISGACSQGLNTIEISTTESYNKRLLFSTVFHEFCHAMLYVSGQAERLVEDGAQEEGLVIMLESYLESVIDWKHSMWGDWKTIELTSKKEEVANG